MKYKQIVQISNVQNVTVFLMKTLPYFCQMQEKLETCRNSNLTNSRRRSFGDDINVTFIS